MDESNEMQSAKQANSDAGIKIERLTKCQTLRSKVGIVTTCGVKVSSKQYIKAESGGTWWMVGVCMALAGTVGSQLVYSGLIAVATYCSTLCKVVLSDSPLVSKRASVGW